MDAGKSMGMTETAPYKSDTEARNEAEGGGSAPSWRAWVISIVAAVVLSVTATLLLGGTFRLPGRAAAVGAGCGDPCCPPGGPPAGR